MSIKEKNASMDFIGCKAVITINRPDKLNAIDAETCMELWEAFSAAEEAENVKVILFKGAGRAFCAGGDIGEMSTLQNEQPSEVQKHVETYQRLARKIYTTAKPIICAVQGAAAGAGFSLALAADVVIAAENAKFIQSFGKVGLVPDCGSSFLLTRAVGPQRAKDLIFSGRPISAPEACRMGIALKVVPAEKLDETAMALADEYAKQASLPAAFCKEMVNLASEKTTDEMLGLEAQYQTKCFFGEAFEEGYRAFLEKREPNFK